MDLNNADTNYNDKLNKINNSKINIEKEFNLFKEEINNLKINNVNDINTINDLEKRCKNLYDKKKKLKIKINKITSGYNIEINKTKHNYNIYQ